MTYSVKLELDFCAAFGCCVAAAPEVFALEEEQKVVLLDAGAPDRAEDDLLMKAAESCPVAAIHLFDADGKQVFPYYL